MTDVPWAIDQPARRVLSCELSWCGDRRSALRWADVNMSEDERIRQSVERYGWHAIFVDESAQSPSFLYTIGLGSSFSHPEVIVFGLPRETAFSIVSTIVEEIRRGASFVDSGPRFGLLGELPLLLRPVHDSQLRKYLAYAVGYYRLVGERTALRAVQFFWPDQAGHLPDDSRCDPLVASAQPRLELPALGDS